MVSSSCSRDDHVSVIMDSSDLSESIKVSVGEVVFIVPLSQSGRFESSVAVGAELGIDAESVERLSCDSPYCGTFCCIISSSVGITTSGIGVSEYTEFDTEVLSPSVEESGSIAGLYADTVDCSRGGVGVEDTLSQSGILPSMACGGTGVLFCFSDALSLGSSFTSWV